jgi:hypothetical protein
VASEEATKSGLVQPSFCSSFASSREFSSATRDGNLGTGTQYLLGI